MRRPSVSARLQVVAVPVAVAAYLVFIAISDREPWGALALGAGFAVFFGLVYGLPRGGRRRRRARRALDTAGFGTWRATLQAGDPLLDQLEPNSRWRAFFLLDARVDVVTDLHGLTLDPLRRHRLLGGLRPLRLGWDEIAGASAGEPVHRMRGNLLAFPLTPVTLLLVGSRVGGLFRPYTDAEAAEDGVTAQERAETDGGVLADLREAYGPGYRYGTQPSTVFVEDAPELVDLVTRFQRGQLPAL